MSKEINKLIDIDFFNKKPTNANYSTDMNDAYSILKNVGNDLKIGKNKNGYSVFVTVFREGELHPTMWNGYQRTGATHEFLPMAICLAVLNALGYEKGDLLKMIKDERKTCK